MIFPRPRVLWTAAVLAALSVPGPLLAWSPKAAPLMTRWAGEVDPAHPLPEYPRPQMVRTDWLNLNGVWEVQPGALGDAVPVGRKLDGEILVPFPVESALSGVMERHDRLWYRRTFTVPDAWRGRRTLLHFGAVDFESEVFVNGRSAGVHKGGYLPFTDDVTPLLTGDGPQELVVRVYDPTDNAGEPRGKQSLHPGGIMYTPTTGIWQTVWLEPVAPLHIESVKIVPDVDAGSLKLSVNTAGVDLTGSGEQVFVQVKEGDTVVGQGQAWPGKPMTIPVPNARLWTPDQPFLYDLEIGLGIGPHHIEDEVKSYFGMRKIEVGDDHGVKKMLLNGKFVFEVGPLDQGFWPDGIYTAPTDAALKNDIETMKACGFNMVRKHLKVEPARWYYWTDKLGLLVWQDMPSANSYLGHHRTLRPEVDTAEFDAELRQMVGTLGNTPSIIMWDLFNEGQGEAGRDVPALVETVRGLDPSRLVNEASGGEWTGHGDVRDIHHYPPPVFLPPSRTQALVCGEYGGIGLIVPGHTWSGRGGGYTETPDAEALRERYDEYAGMVRQFRDEKGLSAVVYTQLTDVENELNGLLTYDRIPKLEPASLVAANHLKIPPAAFKTVVPAADTEPQTWRYTTDKPAHGWSDKNYNDEAWIAGKAGFGKYAALGNTPWKTPDIWLRRRFNPGALDEADLRRLVLRVFHDDDAEAFINGVLAFEHDGYVQEYQYENIRRAAAQAIVTEGENVLAVHCRQRTGEQYIDVGISLRLPMTGKDD